MTMLFTPDWTYGSVLDMSAKPHQPGRWLGGADGRLRFDHEQGSTLLGGTMLLCGYYNADTISWTAYDMAENGEPSSVVVPLDYVLGYEPQETGYYPLLATMKGSKTIAVPVGTTPLDIPAGTLSVPENLRSTDITATSITMAWDYVLDASIYVVRKRVDEGAWTNESGSATWKEFINLIPETLYEFQVRAMNDYGESAWSDSVFISTATPD